jgi:hypothetical protein
MTFPVVVQAVTGLQNVRADPDLYLASAGLGAEQW